MPSVFISYRHENDAHCASVINLATQLEKSGITVVLDAFAEEREFNGGGPNKGWPHWSRKQARNREHKILIIASEGWFRAYLDEEDQEDNVSLGSAAEAAIISARLYRERAATFFRIVKVGSFNNDDIPVELSVFNVFQFSQDFSGIVRWLNASLPRQPFPRGQARNIPLEPAEPPHPPLVRPAQPLLNPKHPQPLLNSIKFVWQTIEGGPYKRGFTRDAIESVLAQMTDPSIDIDSVRAVLESEKPRPENVLDFQIARELVTNAQFLHFTDAANYRTTAERNGEAVTWRNYATPEKVNHPVVQVSFEDAQAFCKWAGVRLPSLDEWLKAYRGPNGNIYPWGNQFDPSKCNTEENKTVLNTSPVDMFARYASPYGCCDMIGNVHEWIDAAGDKGPRVENMNPAVIEHLKRTRAVMGGAWSVPCQPFGLPVVNMLVPVEKSDNDLGFRVAR
jgi:sulfatase modifying factor 1